MPGKRKATAEAQEMAARILDDKQVEERTMQLARLGILPSNIWAMLYHYRYGKPVETIDVTHHVDELAQLPLDELLRRKKQLEEELGDVVH